MECRNSRLQVHPLMANRMDDTLLAEKLKDLFPGGYGLVEPWEQSAWSKSYKVELESGEALYVKGTPRSRAEARTTSFLHGCCPEYIPRVLVEDLLPEHEWHWFVLEDVGECNHTSITLECALQAAFCLGRLQSMVRNRTQLAEYLPQCRADGLQQALTNVCDWALGSAPADMQDELVPFRTRIVNSPLYFRSLQQKLACLPPTCIHGDLWSGNIACRGSTVSFVDWGDALWGVGSVSIVNLLASASEALSGDADDVWGAYSRGWETELTEEFIRASQVAALVSSLVVDVEIAECCKWKADMLPGLIPALWEITSLIA
jgi:hypothetical protein